jgi:NAD+ kinase
MNIEPKRLRFALFGNEFQAKKSASILKVLSFLNKRKAEVFFDRAFYDFLTKSEHLKIEASGVFDGDDFQVDYVISLGGDGTFLKAASRVGAKQTPIIGVNMGRLGFLADVLPSDIESLLDAVYAGDYKTEEHAAIQIETDGEILQESPYALNDIAVLKRDNASMISIRTCIDGDYLTTYQADGLIISTPTGSTAYSLSNGGPIIVPQSGNICLTPVAPHSLNVRPIVIGDEAVVTLTVESRSHNFLVAVDGRSESLPETTKVTIRKAPFAVRIVKSTDFRYFATLRDKMMWGADQRQ